MSAQPVDIRTLPAEHSLSVDKDAAKAFGKAMRKRQVPARPPTPNTPKSPGFASAQEYANLARI